MKALTEFNWPAPGGSPAQPRWAGDHFELAGRALKILQYDEVASGWSDELTQIIELESAQGSNPIDRASRALAVQSLSRLGPGAVILEAGSSSGYLIRDLKKAFPSARLIASDYLPGPLERFTAREPQVPAIQFDLQNCPLPDQCVDGFVALNVLEHIEDDRKCLAHIHRILKPGGLAHLEVPYGPHLFDIYDEFAMHKRRYEAGPFADLVRESGLRIVRATCLGFLVYPYFRQVKMRGQKIMKMDQETKRQTLAGYFKETKSSHLLALALRLELAMGNLVTWPVGVRCVVLAEKPAVR